MTEDHLHWCAQGLHEQHIDGGPLCTVCGGLAGSVLPTEPYDYPAARREVETVHAYLIANGLQQSESDGQWGHIQGYYEPEWSEVGNTVQAIEWVAQRIVGEDCYWRGVEHFQPGFTKLPEGTVLPDAA